ncbi:MAG: hypothetical protein JXQ90_17670 [Cyclobacteriaceae bacterium]
MRTAQFLLILIILSACSAQKVFDKGDFDKAISMTMKKLKKGDNAKAGAVLKESYRYAVRTYEDRIKLSKSSGNQFKWESVVSDYTRLNGLYNMIRRCPNCSKYVPNPYEYNKYLTEAKENAAEVRYQLGTRALQHQADRNKAMEAYEHFEIANRYVPGYKDIANKQNSARQQAILRVVVEPIPAFSYQTRLQHGFFTDKINEYLHAQRFNEFVQFFTPEEVKAKKLDYVDHVIKIEFEQYSLGNLATSTNTYEVVRDSVVLEERNGRPVYGEVKARFTEYEKNLIASGVLGFQIVEVDANKVLSRERFPSEFIWMSQWASYNGDERALSPEQKRVARQREQMPPSQQFMFEQFAGILYDQVIDKMRRFYRNY